MGGTGADMGGRRIRVPSRARFLAALLVALVFAQVPAAAAASVGRGGAARPAPAVPAARAGTRPLTGPRVGKVVPAKKASPSPWRPSSPSEKAAASALALARVTHKPVVVTRETTARTELIAHPDG